MYPKQLGMKHQYAEPFYLMCGDNCSTTNQQKMPLHRQGVARCCRSCKLERILHHDRAHRRSYGCWWVRRLSQRQVGDARSTSSLQFSSIVRLYTPIREPTPTAIRLSTIDNDTVSVLLTSAVMLISACKGSHIIFRRVDGVSVGSERSGWSFEAAYRPDEGLPSCWVKQAMVLMHMNGGQ